MVDLPDLPPLPDRLKQALAQWPARAAAVVEAAGAIDQPEVAWPRVAAALEPDWPIELHRAAHAAVFADWMEEFQGPAPVWFPDEDARQNSNAARLGRERGFDDWRLLHDWSITERDAFWGAMIERLGIHFDAPPIAVRDAQSSPRCPRWLPGAKLNIARSCLKDNRAAPAIVADRADGVMETWTVARLNERSSRIAAGLKAMGLRPGDAVAVDMPMTGESVAIYLAIVRAGMAVVSIADSFAPHEIATRLRISDAKLVFTQDGIVRGNRTLPLYEKVVAAGAKSCIVVPAGDALAVDLRDGDRALDSMLGEANDDFFSADPDDTINILFSSGTTGDPKAIPWTHTTPIKCAMDGAMHLDIRSGDVVAWPTNLGWMMGPWLIFASLINGATIALHHGPPTTRAFAQFVRDARVTMLGLVPSMVRHWRSNNTLDGIDWSHIRCFGSTGECSNADDYFWLSSRARYRPIIEYCGGTEIGGGYITGSMLQPQAPATFSTPALGLEIVIVDECGESARQGEAFLVPPSIGLSNRLLNRDHDATYFDDCPAMPAPRRRMHISVVRRNPDEPPTFSDEQVKHLCAGLRSQLKAERERSTRILRRHGDELAEAGDAYYRAQGRADDTMNLGGIKVASAEIERVVGQVEGVREVAAVAVAPAGGGPSELVVFAVPATDSSETALRAAMQHRIRSELNPLFHLSRVRLIDALPRTASNKVMRRVLREQCQSE